jgi:pyruvate carboxylase
VARAYRNANDLFGDIVKVTPSSKVVGDMALMMVAQELSADDVLDPAREIAFPASVVEMMHGDLGQPPGGWPEALQKKVLKGEAPLTARPGSLLPPADLAAVRAEAEKKCGRQLGEDEFASYLMYPKVFAEFNTVVRRYGPVSALPTPTFFYGMQPGEEIAVEIERGKSLVIRLLTLSEADEEGQVKVFFELNGQQRIVKVPNRMLASRVVSRRKADEGNDTHVAAPMPGLVVTLAVRQGQEVKAGDVIATLEAMKMEAALHAARDGTVAEILVAPGQQVDAKDLILVYA